MSKKANEKEKIAVIIKPPISKKSALILKDFLIFGSGPTEKVKFWSQKLTTILKSTKPSSHPQHLLAYSHDKDLAFTTLSKKSIKPHNQSIYHHYWNFKSQVINHTLTIIPHPSLTITTKSKKWTHTLLF